MLDHEQPTDNTIDPSLPQPPAGRRSRRRPAGPPVEVVEPPKPAPVEVQAPEEPEPEVVEPEVVGPEESMAEEPESGRPAEELTDIDEAAALASAAAAEQPDDEVETSEEAELSEGAAEAEASEASPKRRRRRRGGRRRHTSGDGQSEESRHAEAEGEESGEDGDRAPGTGAAEGAGEQAATEDVSTEESGTDEEESAGAEGSTSSGSSRRRRRRRRRRGEDTGSGADDDPSEVVVKVRETPTSDDKIHGVEGSTRLEAKRQRRREGRAAGRRRAPIVSESEFLARRESVKRQMVLRQSDEYSQIAVLEDGVLVEHYVDRESSSSLIGNIYLGRVQNVLPSMEAAFIDIGRGRNAVLYAGEVDWDAHGAPHSERKIELALRSGQQILVQVTKDPVGAKGARLTNHVSIPGRYVVYAPGGHLSGISRKLPDVERKRLKHILAELIEEGASVIVRTAAEGATQEQLVHDVSRLKAQWEGIEKKAKQGGAPQQLYSEPDLTIRTVRDLFTEDFAELVVDGRGGDGDAYEALSEYLERVAPHLRDRLVHWDRQAKGDVFSHYRLDEQIAKALERKVHLPSGGSLIIDRTEAMTVIDVNTGKFTGHGGNLEATVTANNLEAAEEIVRQLRLRDIGGIIVIDFIDMVLPSNRELLLRRLVECLGRDRTRHQVSEVTSLGLVQLTRKKMGTGLAEAFTEPCEHCNGRGYIVHDMPVATQAPADGGDRQGRNSRRRSRGGRNGGQAGAGVPTTTGGSDQQRAKEDAEKERISDEAKAAAQAAINAMAHAGHKPREGQDESDLLDAVVAALQEDSTSEDRSEAPEAGAETSPVAGATEATTTEPEPAGEAAGTTAEPATAAVPAEEGAVAEAVTDTGAGPAKKAPAKKATARKAPAKKATSAAKKTAAKKATTTSAAKKTTAKKATTSGTARKTTRKATTKQTSSPAGAAAGAEPLDQAPLDVDTDALGSQVAPFERVEATDSFASGEATVLPMQDGEPSEEPTV